MAINDYVRSGAALLSGIALVSQLALPAKALGEDLYAVAKSPSTPTRYEDTNLASLGMPNWEGLTPHSKPRTLDKSKIIDGPETTLTTYNIKSVMVNTYAFEGKNFSIGIDYDWKAPVDLSLVDNTGNGNYVRMDSGTPFKMPRWVEK